MALSVDLKNALIELATFSNGTGGFSDMIVNSAERAMKNENEGDVLSERVKEACIKLSDVLDGATTISTFENELDEYLQGNDADAVASIIKKTIRITHPGSMKGAFENTQRENPRSYSYVNNISLYNESLEKREKTLSSGGIFLDEDGVVSGEEVKIYAVEVLDNNVGIRSVNSFGISSFTSLITPLEMSRCVPYLKIKTNVNKKTVGEENSKKYSGLSLMSFLQGTAYSPEKDSLDLFLSFDETGKENIGMEVFTSPQTLIPNKGSSLLRDSESRIATLDRFRPFMTIKNFSINVVNSFEIAGYEAGKLDFVLHDRSRLSDIANLVRPGSYASVELDIEYGWSHPASNKMSGGKLKNPIGTFLNSLKRRRKYMVVAPSFSLNDAGGVDISLKIADKGVHLMNTLNIGNISNHESATVIQEIIEKISSLSKRYEDSTYKELFQKIILPSVSTADAATNLSLEKISELRTAIAKLRGNNGNASELVGLLDDLFGEKEIDQGKVGQLRNSSAEAVGKQIESLAISPEIFPINDNVAVNESSSITIEYGMSSIENSISLGRVLTSFVGKSLHRSGEFEEIHFMFHRLNNRASYMRSMSIAAFPIPRERLTTILTELFAKNFTVTLTSFMRILNNEFIANPKAEAYGFASSKNQGDNEETGAGISNRERVLEAAGIFDGVFKIPNVNIIPEAVQSAEDETKTILRLHVIDTVHMSSTHEAIHSLVRASNSVEMAEFALTTNTSHPLLQTSPEMISLEKEIATILDEINKKGLVARPNSNEINSGAFQPSDTLVENRAIEGITSISSMKKFIATKIPVIKYGASTGAVIGAKFQGNSDASLATINIQRGMKYDATASEQNSSVGLPMQIFPTECTLEMMGCPLLSFGQVFFIDFGTGTTADNTYYVTGIEHRIEQGSFKTTAKMTFIESYISFSSQRKKIARVTSQLRKTYGIPEPPPAPSSAEMQAPRILVDANSSYERSLWSYSPDGSRYIPLNVDRSAERQAAQRQAAQIRAAQESAVRYGYLLAADQRQGTDISQSTGVVSSMISDKLYSAGAGIIAQPSGNEKCYPIKSQTGTTILSGDGIANNPATYSSPFGKYRTLTVKEKDKNDNYVRNPDGSIKTKVIQRRHEGVDFRAPTGANVYAAASGIIELPPFNKGGYGFFINIRHENGVSTRYAHLSKRLVTAGTRVEKGQLIAYSGDTGIGTGPHLHFELRINGKAIDPWPFLSPNMTLNDELVKRWTEVVDPETGLPRKTQNTLNA